MVPGVLSRVLASLLGHGGSEPNPQTEKLTDSKESVSYPRLAECRGKRSSAGDGEFLLRPPGDRLQRAYGRLDVVDVELAQ